MGLREKVLPKSGLGKACDYLLRHWTPLTKHLEYGETRLDSIRPTGDLLVGDSETG